MPPTPWTLKEFLHWLLTDSLPAPNIREAWNFEGAYIAGHLIRGGDEFPQSQSLDAWLRFWMQYQQVAKEYSA